MKNESIIVEDVLTEDTKLDVSNAVAIYVKNIGASDCNFGMQAVSSSKEFSIDLGGTMLSEKEKVRVSFTNNQGKLFYRIIRFTKCSCNCKK